MVLLFTDPNRNVGGAKGCLLSKIKKVGGAIAPPLPPVLPPLTGVETSKSKHFPNVKVKFRGVIFLLKLWPHL